MQTNHSLLKDAPWLCPQPVKPSRLRSMFVKHEKFNIEIDLNAITKPVNRNQSLVQSDLQNTLTPPNGRLGAGRSGFYSGHYLKGIGRTTLAANWNNRKDIYHNTGHLFLTSAIRELLISDLCKAKKVDSTINSCDGILIANLENHLKTSIKFIHQEFEQISAKKTYLPPAIDKRFRAVTIKDGNFARPSNFIWLLSHLHEGSDAGAVLHDTFKLLAQALHIKSYREVEIDTVFQKLSEASLNTLKNFWIYHFAGINWRSYHNNFSIDGRFIDLETPTFMGGPYIGSLTNHDLKLGGLDGFVILAYQWKMFIEYFKQQINSLSRSHKHKNNEILSYILCQIDQNFPKQSPIMNVTHLLRLAESEICSKNISDQYCDIALSQIRLTANQFYGIPTQQNSRLTKSNLIKALVLAPQAGHKINASSPLDLPKSQIEKAEYFCRLVNQIETCKTIDQIFSQIEKSRSDIKKYFSAAG